MQKEIDSNNIKLHEKEKKFTFSFSSSGYFQYERWLFFSTHQRRCHAPNPLTSSNIVYT